MYSGSGPTRKRDFVSDSQPRHLHDLVDLLADLVAGAQIARLAQQPLRALLVLRAKLHLRQHQQRRRLLVDRPEAIRLQRHLERRARGLHVRSVRLYRAEEEVVIGLRIRVQLLGTLHRRELLPRHIEVAGRHRVRYPDQLIHAPPHIQERAAHGREQASENPPLKRQQRETYDSHADDDAENEFLIEHSSKGSVVNSR